MFFAGRAPDATSSSDSRRLLGPLGSDRQFDFNAWNSSAFPDQMLASKRPSRPAFQITLKFAPRPFAPKRRIKHQFPRHEFPGVSRVAAVMLIHSMTYVVCESSVNFSRMGNTPQQINVVHSSPPSRGTRRLYNVTLIGARDRFEWYFKRFGGHSPSLASQCLYRELVCREHQQIRRSSRKRAKANGGGGSRTPVRKALRHGAYMLISVPFVSPSALRTSKKRSWLVRWFSPKPYGPKGSGQLTV